MTAFSRAVVLVGALLLGACSNGIDPSAAEQRIERLQDRWVQAVADRDVDTIVDLYAEDSWFLPAGSPPLEGREEIRQWWVDTLDDPPFESLTFGPVDIRFSEAGDIAYDVGSSRSVVLDDQGNEQTQKGKYLVVWEKIDGEWKVAADAFNADE